MNRHPMLPYWDSATIQAVHEAAHAAVALLLCVRVVSATIDNPAREGTGLVTLDMRGAEPSFNNLLIILAGPIADGQPLEWPPIDTGAHCDESTAAGLVEHLGLDRERWDEADALCREMLDLRSMKRAQKALTAALHERGTLDGDEVRRIFDEATLLEAAEEASVLGTLLVEHDGCFGAHIGTYAVAPAMIR